MNNQRLTFLSLICIIAVGTLLPLGIHAQGTEPDTSSSSYILEFNEFLNDETDLDWNTTEEEYPFKTVTIGTQVWMAENLNVTTFRNGDPINEVTDNIEWRLSMFDPAWCYYNNDPANGATYGRLYNIVAINDYRGLAPEGWHIPSEAEWRTLLAYLGAEAYKKMKSTGGWKDGNNGTNASNFSALPGGCRDHTGEFESLGVNGYWWSSTANAAGKEQMAFFIRYYMLTVDYGQFANNGFSVRCIKD